MRLGRPNAGDSCQIGTVPDIMMAERDAMSVENQADYVGLYKQAFAEYRSHALWFMQPFEHPTPDDALAVARALRVEGDLPARRLAEQIEQACHAAQ